jgi:type 2 lantibiotic biosynthesis protein LanM
MPEPLFDASDWYRALTLEERRDLLRRSTRVDALSAEDRRRARERIARWRAQRPFGDDTIFAARLAADDLTLAELEEIVCLTPEHLAQLARARPAWLETLRIAFRDHGESIEMRAEVLAENPQLGFLYLIEPLVRFFRARLIGELRQLNAAAQGGVFDPEPVTRLAMEGMVNRLLRIINKLCVLELNVARERGDLTANEPAERLHQFLQRLRQRDLGLALLREYPVAVRLLVDYMEAWLDASTELFQRLRNDWALIAERFAGGQELGDLTAIGQGAGDRHHRGRAVTLLSFSGGLQLYYKPKPLATDLHFQQLLADLNRSGIAPAFPLLELCDRGHYGWVESVEYLPCGNRDQVRRFYQRLGGYLALLYALHGSDFHYENLVACGEQPYLVDLESFFTPDLYDRSAADPGWLQIADSVLRAGLLPRRIYLRPGDRGLDTAAISLVDAQRLPYPAAYWEGSGSDELKLVKRDAPLKEGKNRPRLGSDPVNPLEYAPDLLAGFEQVYRHIERQAPALLAPGGAIASFARDPVRYLSRMTLAYTYLLGESDHPDLLRDGLALDQHWDALWIGYSPDSLIPETFVAERAALRRNDVPKFSAVPTSRHLQLDGAGTCLKDLFPRRPFDVVGEKLSRLSPRDCVQQLWLIRAALATADARRPGESRYALEDPGRPLLVSTFLAAARRVADRLEQLSFADADGLGWIGLWMNDSGGFDLIPLHLDLYHGLAGQSLFLSYLARGTGEERYHQLAAGAVRALVHHLPTDLQAPVRIGAFDGLGGVLYALSHVGLALNDPSLLQRAIELVPALASSVEVDTRYDIVGGAAGCIAAALALAKVTGSEEGLALACRCGDHLLAHAVTMEQGIGWKISSRLPLTGFSHGAAGIGLALLELARASGVERYRAAARQAFAYERSLFDAMRGDWPDLRDVALAQLASAADGRQMTAWCSGAPGIGLSRLRAMELDDDPRFAEEVRHAIERTIAGGFGHSHCLCHGDLGNLELLQRSVDLGTFSRFRATFESLSRAIVHHIEKTGWICGVPTGVETPGLMCGITGIGYGLLRLAAPEQVPSVLLLEPPRVSSAPTDASQGPWRQRGPHSPDSARAPAECLGPGR